MKNIHIQKPINADTKWHAGQTVILYRYVPEEMQGRIFAVRNALQFSTIPLGILLGGILADYVFEPFMMTDNPVAIILQKMVGTGAGSAPPRRCALRGIHRL